MHSRIIFSLCFISVLIGQTTFTEHTISTSADGAHNAYAEDVDGDLLSFEGSSTESNLTVKINDSELIVTPNENWNGNANINIANNILMKP